MSEEYPPEGYIDYPNGVLPYNETSNSKIEFTFINQDIFIINQKKAGNKYCPSLKRLKKLSKYYNTLATKIYNNFLDNSL